MTERPDERPSPFQLADGDLRVAGQVLATHASRAARAQIVPASLAWCAPAARAVPLGEWFELEGVRARFEPGQLLLERDGATTNVITGACDATVAGCDVLALDTSYALPVFRWPAIDAVRDELRAWVQLNRDAGRAALLAADPSDEQLRLRELLAPDTEVLVNPANARGLAKEAKGKLVLVPTSELRAPTLKLGPHETALASGRMRVRGNRRRLAIDRGFVLSSRADWPTLLRAVEQSGAREVVTFGAQADAFARFLREQGKRARELAP